MSITAKELAKQLGLSPSAVSIALNNKPGISTETRKKILDAARVSNYDFSKIGEKKTTAGTIYFCRKSSPCRQSRTRPDKTYC